MIKVRVCDAYDVQTLPPSRAILNGHSYRNMSFQQQRCANKSNLQSTRCCSHLGLTGPDHKIASPSPCQMTKIDRFLSSHAMTERLRGVSAQSIPSLHLTRTIAGQNAATSVSRQRECARCVVDAHSNLQTMSNSRKDVPQQQIEALRTQRARLATLYSSSPPPLTLGSY